jgi:branched-chain amino acid aminotransferase
VTLNGEWQNRSLPYAPFLLDPSARVFSLWSSFFEGMKAYKDESDDVGF